MPESTVRMIRSVATALAVSVGAGAGAQAEGPTLDAIAAQIARDGTARVTVLLDTPFEPEGTLGSAAAAKQRQAIRAAEDAFLDEVLKGPAGKVLNRFAWMPAVVLEIDASTLERIQRSRRVKAVEADPLMQPMAPTASPAPRQ